MKKDSKTHQTCAQCKFSLHILYSIFDTKLGPLIYKLTLKSLQSLQAIATDVGDTQLCRKYAALELECIKVGWGSDHEFFARCEKKLNSLKLQCRLEEAVRTNDLSDLPKEAMPRQRGMTKDQLVAQWVIDGLLTVAYYPMVLQLAGVDLDEVIK